MTQAQAIDIMKLGFNVFLTGPPGAGKTYVLNQFVDYLQENSIAYGVTASTGIAATHIGGTTLHSWSGIGVADELTPERLARMLKNQPLVKRLRDSRVLVIDEVSMLHGVRLDMVDQLLRLARESDKAFGGLQVILSGDLFQLPPVTRERGVEVDFVFKSQAWRELNLKICYINEQHRADDSSLLQLLDAIRSGEIDDAHYETLLQRQLLPDQPATRLFTHNADVDQLNQDQLRQIETSGRTFSAETSGRRSGVEQLLKSVLAPELLELKVGAEIMCVANKPQLGLMNGSRGRVINFKKDGGAPVIELYETGRIVVLDRHSWSLTEGDRVVAEYAQYPVRLAWAITIHKSQGMSLDAAEIDLSRSFEPGMGYVALSRLRSLEGLFLKGINNMAFVVHPEVSVLDQRLQAQSQAAKRALELLQAKQLVELQERVRSQLSPQPLQFDAELFEQLRDWRAQKAAELKKPAYIILPDKSLQELAAYRPTSLEALERINGIGPAKLDLYGKQLLKLLK